MKLSHLFEHSNAELIATAKAVGEKLFGKSHTGLVFTPKVEKISYSTYLQQQGDAGATVGTMEYVFYPSKGTGVDASDSRLSKKHVDVDGKIYIAGADGVFVIDNPFVKSGPKPIDNEEVARFKKEVLKHFPTASFKESPKPFAKYQQLYAYDLDDKMVGQYINKGLAIAPKRGQPSWLVHANHKSLASHNW